MNRLVTADARTTSPVDFLRALQGKPPLTDADRAEKQRQADEFWAERRKQNRAEIEQIRDNLCALASPELAAEWRAKWADEDSLLNMAVEQVSGSRRAA
jgi:hypothetical protein